MIALLNLHAERVVRIMLSIFAGQSRCKTIVCFYVINTSMIYMNLLSDLQIDFGSM